MADPRSGRGFQLVGEPREGSGGESEPVTFSTFVLSLSTSALFHLGVPMGQGLGLPELAEPKLDLETGRQTIEMLEMLRRKTRGNLDPDEARLLDEAIHDLQRRYIEAKQKTES